LQSHELLSLKKQAFIGKQSKKQNSTKSGHFVATFCTF